MTYDLVNGGYIKDTVKFTVKCPRPELAKIKHASNYDYFDYLDCCSVRTETNSCGLTGIAVFYATDGAHKFSDVVWTFSVLDFSYCAVTDINISYNCKYNHLGLTEEEVRKGLTALYNACNGKNWTNQKNWLSEKDITEWEGVWYDTYEEEVINGFKVPVATFGIELPNNNIKGIIPEEFWEICKLCTKIDLACNDLTGNKVHPNVWNERMFSVHFIDTNIEVTLDDAINAPNLGHLLVDETKCKAPTEKFFNAKFPRLIRLTATFDSPSPLPDNVINFKENAPILVQMFLWNVSSYPENITDLTQLYALYINGHRLINRMDEYEGSVFG
jgi:hypothetical protein